MTQQAIRRIDPRRAYVISPNGLKRIVLGNDTGSRELFLSQHAAAKKMLRTSLTCTGHFMAVVYSDRGMLDAHARETIAACALLADQHTSVLLVVLGELNAAAEELAGLGADQVMNLPELDSKQFCPERTLALMNELLTVYQPAHLFFADRNADGDLARRLAAQSKSTIATQVVELSAGHVLRTIPGNCYARSALPQFVLLARHAADANLPFVGHGTRIAAPAIPVTSTGRIRDLGIDISNPDSISLEEADFIVSAGNGMRDMDGFTEMAALLGASIGASRVAVDDGRFARDKQVGATGKTVQASAYIAMGISGAVQHLQGIKECQHVIAVNLDDSAPIVKRASLTVVEDTGALMRALNAQIKAEINSGNTN